MSAPIRITLGVPNDSQPIKVHVESNKQRRQIDVTAPIVEETLPTYEGPYSVTPSEEVQTLETDGKRMTDDVTVNPAPPAVLESYHEFTVSPYGTPDENGVINVKGSNTRGYFPVEQSGWVSTSKHIVVTAQIDGSIQLPTQAGETITPTESEQTAVEPWKYTVGEVKVAAIPSDYVGSDIPQRASSDMTASGAIVTAPAGYYAAAATKSVDIGSATVNDTGITANPSISVGNDGKVTATVSKVQSVAPQVTPGYVSAGTAGDITVTGYTEQQLTTQAAQTITPTTADQTIASGTYLTGAQTILGDANLVPESIVENITIFGVTGNAPPPVTVVHLI